MLVTDQHMEIFPVTLLSGRFLATTAAAAAFAVLSFGAQAQEKKVDPKAPAKKTACNSLKVQTGCEGRSDCNWVAETKDDKGKVKRKAYCRANPVPKKA
jgi:hypothetical protein